MTIKVDQPIVSQFSKGEYAEITKETCERATIPLEKIINNKSQEFLRKKSLVECDTCNKVINPNDEGSKGCTQCPWIYCSDCLEKFWEEDLKQMSS
jgi:hypothetical protein